MAKLQQLETSSLYPSKNQPRTSFKDTPLKELAESISKRGIIQPIVVRETSHNKFEIIAGERRWRAAQLVNLTKIPCIVNQYSDEEAAKIALIENLQREDMNALDEAEGYNNLLECFPMSKTALGEELGKSRSYISNTLRLLNLTESVKPLVRNKTISPYHARALLALDKTRQEEVANLIVAKELSVQATERIIKRIKEPKTKGSLEKSTNIEIAYLEESLSQKLGTKVTINHKGSGGQVILELHSFDQIKGLGDRLSQ
jgi:ParB family chromosome partitioning protein